MQFFFIKMNDSEQVFNCKKVLTFGRASIDGFKIQWGSMRIFSNFVGGSVAFQNVSRQGHLFAVLLNCYYQEGPSFLTPYPTTSRYVQLSRFTIWFFKGGSNVKMSILIHAQLDIVMWKTHNHIQILVQNTSSIMPANWC
jgi:hypothetical protein